MSVAKFISSKFNSRNSLPRSIRAMRTVAMVGIAVSVAALIVATSIGRGFEKRYREAILDFNSHVVVMGTGEVSGLDKIVKEGGSDITGATPFLYREALAIGGGKIRGVVVKGIDPLTLRQVNSMNIKIYGDERPFEEAFSMTKKDTVKAIAGRALIDDLSIAGDNRELKLLIPTESQSRKAASKFQKIEIVGEFESGMHDYDAQFLLADIPDVRRLFSAGDKSVTGVELKIKNPFEASRVAGILEEKLGAGFRAVTWDELNHELLAAVRLEKIVSAIIIGIMVIVAALNIIAVLVLTAIHRQHELSILKAIGLPDSGIRKLLMGSGVRMGVVGIIAGLIFGLLVALAIDKFHFIRLEEEIYLIRSLPVDISVSICGLIAVFCLVVTVLASYIVSQRLSILPVAEGLRVAK